MPWACLTRYHCNRGGACTPRIRARPGPDLGGRFLRHVLTNEPDNDAAMVRMGTSDIGTPAIPPALCRGGHSDRRDQREPVHVGRLVGRGKIVLPGVASRRCIYHNHKTCRTPMELRRSSLLA
jgi:hypothetical protein